MNKYLKLSAFIVSLSVLLFLISPGYAQQGTLSLQIIQTGDVGNFYLGDLNALQMQNFNGRHLFNFQVDNTNGPETNLGRFEFEIFYIPASPSGGPSGQLATFNTNEIIVPAGANWFMTNIELINGYPLPGNIPPQLIVEDFDVKLDMSNKILEYYRNHGGKFPTGQYQFSVTFAGLSEASAVIIVTNPSLLHLTYPGVPSASGILGLLTGTIPNPAPNFNWISDSKLFNLYVYEQHKSDQSPQDAFGHEPVAKIENIEGNTFQYPSISSKIYQPLSSGLVTESEGAVKSLEDGNTYYWYVEAKIPTIETEIFDIIKSEIFQFKISSTGAMSPDLLKIIEALKDLLGADYEKYLRELNGFEPTGTIVVNDEKIKVEDLKEIIDAVLKGEMKVKKVEIY